MSQTNSLDLEASSSQYASIADAAQTGLDITGDVSFEAWIKFETLPSVSGTRQYILAKDNYVSGERGYAFYVFTGNQLSAYFANSSDQFTEVRTSAAAFSATGVWYHIAASIDVSAGSSGIKFYVNGREIAATAVSSNATSIGANSAEFAVGYQPPDANFFDGLIKDVRVFSDIRTQAEIVSDARTQNVTDANLVGEWNFNNAYTDSSGNSNTLTASGSPVFSTDIPWEGATDVSGSTYLETNLVGWWDMNGTLGTAAKIDNAEGTAAMDLTENASVASATGKITPTTDGGYAVSGTDNYVYVADNAGLDVSAIGIAGWFKTSSNTVGFIDRYTSSSAGERVFYSQITAAGLLSVVFYDNAGSNQVALTSTTAINDGAWHFFAVTSVSGRQELFIDGISEAARADAYTLQTGTPDFRIGRGNPVITGDPTADVDGFAYYGRALHYGDVLDLYNAGSGITYVSSTAYTMVADVGAFVLTGVATTLNKALSMIASVGSFALTGIAAALSKGYSIVADVGTFALTGVTATLTKTLNMVASAGSFTLTGVAATFSRGVVMATSVGEFVLTGIAARFPLIYTRITKNSTNYSTTAKNSTSYSTVNKNSTDYTETPGSNL